MTAPALSGGVNTCGRIRPAAATVVVGATLVLLSACSACRIVVPDDPTFVVASYNLENLFDERANGREYPEFLPEAGWDADDVADRLRGVASVVEAIRPAPDLLVLVEVEQQALVDRLFEEFLVDLPLEYRCFVRGPDSATGVAVASRYPVAGVRALLARAGNTPPLRPTLEVRVRLPEGDLIVFANHWKSKLGSAAATEPLRRAAAGLVRRRLDDLAESEPDLAAIVAGDLNERGREGQLTGWAYPTALVDRVGLEDSDPPWDTPAFRASRRFLPVVRDRALVASGDGAALFDPWQESGYSGSYWFFGEWEQIDHLLMNGAALDGPVFAFERFFTVAAVGAVDDGGRPLSWTEDGVSDHLPVVAAFRLVGR